MILTDLPGVGVGEEVHEEMNSPEAKGLVVGGESPLQLLVVDEAAPVLVSHLETRHNARVRPRREGRRDQSSEGATVRRWRRISSRRRRTVAMLLLLVFFALLWGLLSARWAIGRTVLRWRRAVGLGRWAVGVRAVRRTVA